MAARHYELMIILAPDLEERTIAPSLEQFLTVIRNSGGTVEKIDVWGRRRLAYEIRQELRRHLRRRELLAEPDATVELDRQLNLNESVLRTKVLRLPEKSQRAVSSARSGRLNAAPPTRSAPPPSQARSVCDNPR